MAKIDMLNKRLAKQQERINKHLEEVQKAREIMRNLRCEKYEAIINFLEKHNVEDLKEVKAMYEISHYLKDNDVENLPELKQRLASSTGDLRPEMTRYAQENNAQELQ